MDRIASSIASPELVTTKKLSPRRIYVVLRRASPCAAR